MCLRNWSFSCLSNRVEQSSWRQFFWPSVNSCGTYLSIFFFPISRKCLEMVDLVFLAFCASLRNDVRCSAFTTSLRVSSSRDRFIPVCLTSSSFSSPCRNLWNHLCAVQQEEILHQMLHWCFSPFQKLFSLVCTHKKYYLDVFVHAVLGIDWLNIYKSK